MTTILLTGIVGTGKSDLIKSTEPFLENAGQSLCSVNVGEIILERCRKTGIDTTRINEMPGERLQELRTDIGKIAGYDILNSKADHAVIETPLKIFNRGGIYRNCVPLDSFDDMRGKMPIERVMSVIDDPPAIKRRIESKGCTAYPTDRDSLLSWTTADIERSRDFAKYYTDRDIFVFPFDYSESTIAKMLTENDAASAYLAQPISNIRPEDKDYAAEMINTFRDKLQEYCVVLNPIEGLKSMNGGEEASDFGNEGSHIMERDKEWLVPSAETIIAYFPVSVYSSGVLSEMEKGKRYGKALIYIRPQSEGGGKADSSPFGRIADITCNGPDEFFSMIYDSKTKSEYKSLRRFLSKDGTEPLFKRLCR